MKIYYNHRLYLKVIVVLCFLCSCSPTRVYTTGSYGSLKSYTEKQHYVDKNTTETYISGDLSFGRHEQDGNVFNDKKTIAALNIHRNTTGKHFNFYYGLGATFGTYKFKEAYQSIIGRGEKSKFFAVNFKSGINYTYSRPKIDWRFIGVELSYLNESGAYQDKLSELSTVIDNDLIVANQRSMLTYQLYSEYVFKISSNEAFTLGFYFGDLMNFKNSSMYDVGTGFSGFTLGLRLKKYTISTIFETGQGDITSTKIGLTYQF